MAELLNIDLIYMKQTNKDMAQNSIDEYIMKNYTIFLTEKEKRELNLCFKIANYNKLKKEFTQTKKNKKELESLLTKLKTNDEISDSEVETYTDDYCKIIISRAVERILSMNAQDLFINKCPICGCLARTPVARQASCGHRWSDYELQTDELGRKLWVKK